MEDGGDNEPKETESRNALPWELSILIMCGIFDTVSPLNEFADILEKSTHFTENDIGQFADWGCG
jgi:hypothetical protein